MWNTTVKAALDNSLLTTPAGEELSTSESWCVWICAGRKKIEIDTKNSIGRERVTHHMPKCPQVSHKPPFVALLGKGNLAFQRTLHAKAKIHIWKCNIQALSDFVCWRKPFWSQIMCLEVAKWNKTVEDFCSNRPRTKPGLLVPLHFNGQAKVGQLDGGVLAFTGQEQVLRLGGRSGTHSYYCWTKIWYMSPFNTEHITYNHSCVTDTAYKQNHLPKYKLCWVH